jgi:hypothetical protein
MGHTRVLTIRHAPLQLCDGKIDLAGDSVGTPEVSKLDWVDDRLWVDDKLRVCTQVL